MRMAAEQGFNIIFAPFAASMMFGSLANAVARFRELATAAGHPDVKAMCSYFTCIADTPAQKRQAQERLLYYLTGTVEEVIRQFDQVEAAGVEEVICYFNFGLLPHAETVRQMERVAHEVMPHFAPAAEAAAVPA